MLHTVNKSPFEKNSLESCLRLAKSGSDILLIEDGVYAALRETQYTGKVSEALGNHRLYVLGPDLQARGIATERVVEGIEIIDYDGFVKLTVENDRCQAWL